MGRMQVLTCERVRCMWAVLSAQTIQLSNISAIVKKYGTSGSWFTYRGTTRAQIMDRDHAKVDSIDTMKSFMRYNNFKHDPLSRCSCTPPYTGENAIACRSDLNPADGVYPIPAFGASPSNRLVLFCLFAFPGGPWHGMILNCIVCIDFRCRCS